MIGFNFFRQFTDIFDNESVSFSHPRDGLFVVWILFEYENKKYPQYFKCLDEEGWCGVLLLNSCLLFELHRNHRLSG